MSVKRVSPFRGKTIEERLTIHKPTLHRLAKEMGLEGGTPKVTLVNYPRSRFKGRYVGVTGDGTHRISLARDLTIGDADFVLCHELTHALQCQRFGGDLLTFSRQWLKEMQEVGLSLTAIKQGRAGTQPVYSTTPLEREAWKGAERWLPWCAKHGYVVRRRGE